MDSNALAQIFSLQSAAWSLVAIIFLLVVRLWNGSPAMFAQWIEYRKTKEAAKAADWTRLRAEIERLDGRCIRLEDAEAKCRDDLASAKERIATLEGYQIGRGRAAQDAAGIVALERQKDEPKGPRK